jgi:hypothetical protein
MFKRDFFKDWSHVQLPYCGWYLDCPNDINIKSKCQFREKYGEANLEKNISTYSNLTSVKQSQNAKRIRKLKKHLPRLSSENLNVEDFIGAMVSGEEGATHDRMVKTPMT